MATAVPRVHIICGLCGCNKMMEYEIIEEIDDETNEKKTTVYISCKNCGCLSGINEIIKEK